MLIQYLITCVHKSIDEIVQLVSETNINGNFLIGNQMCTNDEEIIIEESNRTLHIFNMTSKGVSLNRNILLKNATADFITFMDDDMYMLPGFQSEFENIVRKECKSCLRFNVISDNENRPIHQIKKKGIVSFMELRSFGVWGCVYNRHFLINNSIFFDEEIGPGTELNHGEDAVFNCDYCHHGKAYQYPLVAFHAKQDESTWQADNRNVKNELITQGYIYIKIYQNMAFLFGLYHLIKHRKIYNQYRFIASWDLFKTGVEKYRENNKNKKRVL